MKCLKCGRETDQTFCESCRAEMEKYPVKPGTIVLLPKERTPVRKATQRFQRISMETVVKAQRRTIRRMAHAIIALVVLLGVMSVFLIRLVNGQNDIPLGKNYSTVTKPSASTSETTETFVTFQTEADSNAFSNG